MSKTSKPIDEVVDTEDEDAIPVSIETAQETALTTNIYDQIRKRLALRGVPLDQVAFIHDAKTPIAKAKLFAAVNRGEIRVLLGSTEKMSTGMNVQERCIAMHILTPPWRPGDIEQQVGRMVRQGNLFHEVFQFVHVTEGSFDGYVWQLLENKAGFIAQLSRGGLTGREVEDVSDNVMTFSEIKALASGNPLIMQKIVLDAEYQRLSALKYSFDRSKSDVNSSIRSFDYKKEEARKRIAEYQAAIQTRDANPSEKFQIGLKPSLDDDTLEIETDREQAGRKIHLLAQQAAMRLSGPLRVNERYIEIGNYRGLSLFATVANLTDIGEPIPVLFFRIGYEMFQINGDTNTGLTRSMDLRLKSIDAALANAEDEIAVLDRKTEAALVEINRTWDHEDKFIEVKTKLAELDALLNKDKQSSEKTDSGPAPVPTPGFIRKTIAQKSDTDGEVKAAFTAINAAMGDPAIVSRLAGSVNILTIKGLDDLSRDIEQKQDLLDFGTEVVMQLGLFGEPVAAEALQHKRRRK